MAFTDITPTTKLGAVNEMLRAIGEAPVTSLSNNGGLEVPNALANLEEVLRAVLLEGWEFNTEYDYPLALNADNEIEIPLTALVVDVDRRGNWDIDPVVRGRRLYDRANHTYKFDKPMKARIVFGLPYDELPEAARFYVAYRSCRKFQDTHVGSDLLHQFTRADEAQARSILMDTELEGSGTNMLYDTPDFMHIRGTQWR